MLRKLRRLRVPVCFYTCCSLFAILLFVSFHEDVKNFIQHTPNRGDPASEDQPHLLFSNVAERKNIYVGNEKGRYAYPMLPYVPIVSHFPSHDLSSIDPPNKQPQAAMQLQVVDQSFHANSANSQVKLYSVEKVKGSGGNYDDDAIHRYINENFNGHPDIPLEESLQKEKENTQRETSTTIVISNLAKLAQQANPNALNSFTADSLNGFTQENELSQGLNEAQVTTSDTELSYPGGDANSQVKKRDRQWFMTGGDYFPTPPGGLASLFYPSSSWQSLKPSAADYANLWYDSSSGSDRVIEQLMFAIDDPINYANISWGFEGPTATTVRPMGSPTEDPFMHDSSNELNDEEKLIHPEKPGSSLSRRYDLAASNSKALYLPPSLSRGRYINENMPLGTGMSPSQRDPRLGKIKTILLYYGLGMSWGSHITNGRQTFLQQKCPVNACRLTGNRAQLSKADLVVFKDVFMHPKIKRPPGQLWVMYMLECPLNTQNFLDKNAFNLTATYRHDSDIVTPYEKWVYFDDTVRSLPQAINYAEGKTKKVAWFVSNCVAKNNRLEYARELAKYIEVDIYGACGSHTCSRANTKQCFEMLSKDYKFYLAFENSNCRDYISEKFFVNGLGNSVLPIVMGAHPDDYKRVAPDRSYIHVDDFSSAKELAQYLHELDANDDLYNEYFKWKGTGEFINTHFFCRLCAMAHYSGRSARKPSHYEDFNKWWRGSNVCTRQSWRSTPDIFAPENYDSIVSHSYH